MHAWSLPEYVEDILPPLSWRVEEARRALLDLFRLHGYQLVLPPLLEYLPALTAGSGGDLSRHIVQVPDPFSDQALGIRADMTPQAARIDGHALGTGGGVCRLCYAGPVLHARPLAHGGGREPLQVGAELFGHAGLDADLEIQQLLLRALAVLGWQEVHLDLGHVAVSQALLAASGFTAEQQAEVHAALQAKDADRLAEQCAGLEPRLADGLLALPGLYGGPEVLDHARVLLPDLPGIGPALEDLGVLARRLEGEGADVCLDLAELRGWRYHNGVVFSVYRAGHPAAVARGGRYDGVGAVFGLSRPATGFSLDLRPLVVEGGADDDAVLAPAMEDACLQQAIAGLRAQGCRVVVDLAGEGPRALGCRRLLVRTADGWHVEEQLDDR